MKNIPKIIPVMYAKALKDGTLVWGEDCVSATNDFEEDGFTGVALVRLSDVDACQTNEQGRAAEGAVSPCQHDHVPKVRCFACPETDDRKHCERDCLVVQRGTPDETEYLCQAWGETHGGSVDRVAPGEYRSAPTECAWDGWQAARSSPGAGLRLVPEVPNESVLLFLMGGLVEPQEADELQDEITQEEADAINDRCRTDARLHYAEILNIATKDAA